ncbi:zinc knuckle (CCHC-type) family protein [Striga asiatica]|uniref:Zinc knuckle (CCHC-type) family protein n=1 Tax=Striga asiatica TaxID=4170 RepID=A0A5A7QLH9_STRAF|nr:zinc knuckle (CCHC-type) family protein [Striga asiatica]
MIRQKDGIIKKISSTGEKASLPEGTERDASMINDNKFVRNTNKRKRKTRCYVCGDVGHDGEICHKVTSCLICSNKGHLITDCPNKNDLVDFTSRLCVKCGNTGHDIVSCTHNYDSEDLKACEHYAMDCYICGKSGHLCCVDDKSDESTGASCYKCGLLGHFGSDCVKLNDVAAFDSKAFCKRCNLSGHYRRKCPQKTAAERAEKRRAQRARRSMKKKNPNPILNTNQNQQQPNARRPPHLVGPSHEQPESNVCPPPIARANPNNTHQVGPVSGPDIWPPPTTGANPNNTHQVGPGPGPDIWPPPTTRANPNNTHVAMNCYICGKSGHLCCVDDKSDGSTGASCCKCGRLGHFGSDCMKMKLNDVAAFDPQAFCKRCKLSGHYRRKCPQKQQPNARRPPQLVGPSHEQPESNVWQPPTARANPNNTHQVGPGPGPDIWQPPTTRANPNNTYQVGPGPGPGPLPPHQYHMTHQLGTRVPNFRYPQNQYWNFPSRPQITEMPFSRGRIMVLPPQPQTQSRIFRTHADVQTEAVFPQTVSRVNPNYNIPVLPSQFPAVVQNNPWPYPSHRAPVLGPLTGNYFSQRLIYRETGAVPPPHHLQTYGRLP